MNEQYAWPGSSCKLVICLRYSSSVKKNLLKDLAIGNTKRQRRFGTNYYLPLDTFLSELIRKGEQKKRKLEKKRKVTAAGTCLPITCVLVATNSQEPVLLCSEDHTISSCMQFQGRAAEGLFDPRGVDGGMGKKPREKFL